MFASLAIIAMIAIAPQSSVAQPPANAGPDGPGGTYSPGGPGGAYSPGGPGGTYSPGGPGGPGGPGKPGMGMGRGMGMGGPGMGMGMHGPGMMPGGPDAKQPDEKQMAEMREKANGHDERACGKNAFGSPVAPENRCQAT